MKIRPVGAELFHADRRTDRHNEATVAFPSLAKALKNQIKQFWTGNVLESEFLRSATTELCPISHCFLWFSTR